MCIVASLELIQVFFWARIWWMSAQRNKTKIVIKNQVHFLPSNCIYVSNCERREHPSQSYGTPKKRYKILNIGCRTILYRTFLNYFSILNWFQTWTGPARPRRLRDILVTLFRSLFLRSCGRYEFLLLIEPRATL